MLLSQLSALFPSSQWRGRRTQRARSLMPMPKMTKMGITTENYKFLAHNTKMPHDDRIIIKRLTKNGSSSKYGKSVRALAASTKSCITSLIRFRMSMITTATTTVKMDAIIAAIKYVFSRSVSACRLNSPYLTHKNIVAIKPTTTEANKIIQTTIPTRYRNKMSTRNENTSEMRHA